ncbi:GNAT family N-acetyltransferase [Lachnospiraceae bacterium C1.1]|nr:GNAT family N-acetyltransferase [Lachnospiraceae bacterium C1.1]
MDLIVKHFNELSTTELYGYYAKEGFEVVSESFMEDGIPHVKMEKLTI